MIKTIASSFILGLSFGWGPCLASCGALLLSYIAGTGKNVSKGIITYLLFSLSRIFVYLVLGLAVFFSGRFIFERFFNLFKLVSIGAGMFVILLGVLMISGKGTNFLSCSFLHRHILEKDNKSIIILGLIMGILPCAPLITMLTYAGLISRNGFENLLYIFSFGLGTIVSPLVILAGLTGVLPRLRNNIKPCYEKAFNIVCGFIMAMLGIQLIIKGL